MPQAKIPRERENKYENRLRIGRVKEGTRREKMAIEAFTYNQLKKKTLNEVIGNELCLRDSRVFVGERGLKQKCYMLERESKGPRGPLRIETRKN